MGEPAYKLPEEDRPDIRPHLREQEARPQLGVIEGGGESSPRSEGHLRSVDDEDEAPENDELGTGSSSGPSQRGFYRPEGGSGSTKGGANTEAVTQNAEGQSRLSKFKNRYFEGAGKFFNNKWVIGAGVGASTIGVVVILLLLMFSAYKIPHLTANISAWRFARVMSRAAMQNDRTMSTKIAIDAADNSAYSRLQRSYYTGKGKVADTWSKFDKYRPNKQISNLNASGMKFNYSGRRLVGITINDKTLLTPKSNFVKDRIPFYKFTQNVQKAQLFAPELKTAMRLRADDPGIIVRGVVNTKLRKQLGINYVAWKVGQYKGKSTEQVRIAEEQANARVVTTADPVAPTTQQLADEVDDAKKAQEATNNDPAKTKQAILNNGVSQDVAEAVDKAGKQGLAKTLLGIFSAPYAIAVPLCIIYDGSVDRSGSTVDANSQAQEKAWGRIQTIGDQEKDGTTVDPKVIEAYSAKAGDPTQTAISKRMEGVQYTTAGAPSPQAGGNGSFTLFDAAFSGAPSIALTAANTMTGNSCKVLTNTKAAIGIGILSLVGAFFSAGTSETAEVAAGKAATVAVDKIAEKAVSRFSITKALRGTLTTVTGGAKLKTFFAKETGKIVGTAGITLLAQYYVANKAGLLNNGLEQGGDYVAQIDSGADLNANEISRQYQFGRPLTKDEVKAANVEAATIVAQTNASKSTYQRYLAMSNPNSLISSIGSTVTRGFNGSSFTDFFRSIGSVFSPGRMADQLSSIVNPTAKAAAAGGEANYFNIQWGWTQPELNKLKSDPSYEVLENQLILDNSGQEDAIASKYGKCFGTDGTTIGVLLANGDIQRDEEGNVLASEGDCSPVNLGMGNEMVFRWRAAQADRADLDEKDYEQVVTTSSDETAGANAGTEFNIATLNIFHSDGQTDATWGARLDRSVQALVNAQVDIAGLQEVRPNQNKAFREGAGGATYGLYPAASSTKDPNFTPNPVIWNKEKYQMVMAMPGLKVSYFEDSVGETSQEVTIVKMQDNVSGQPFIVANTHDPADTARHGENSDLRLANANRYAKYFKDLHDQTQLPIFFTGDFNNRYDVIAKRQNDPLNNLCTNLTYRIVSGAGVLLDAYDASTGRAAPVCPAKAASAANSNSIDHIFVDAAAQASNFKILNDRGETNNGSDTHDTVTAHIVIPASSSNTGGGSTFKIGTYNITVKAGPSDWAVAANNITNKANGFDVVGAQELEKHANYDIVRNNVKKEGYAIYPDIDPGEKIGRNGMNSTAIIWNTAKFEVAQPPEMFSYPRNDDEGYSRAGETVKQGMANAPVVFLRDKATGQMVIVTNIHNAAFPNRAQQRYEANKLIVAEIQSLQSRYAGVPIFLTGDFNEGTGVRTSGNTTFQKDYHNLLYCMFADNKLMNSTEAKAGNKATSCPNASIGGVDYIYATPGVQAKQFGEIPAAKSGSDHPAKFVTMTVPGEPAGGGTTTAPSKGYVGNDGFGGGSCVDYVKYILSRHSSKYHGGPTGDGKDVAAGLSKYGYAVDHKPAVHAVVSFPTSLADATYGHVAIVAQLNGDGSIVVEESNWNNTQGGGRYGTHTVSADEVPKLTYAHTEVGWH